MGKDESKNYGVDINYQKIANDLEKGINQAFQKGQKAVNVAQEKIKNNPIFEKALLQCNGYHWISCFANLEKKMNEAGIILDQDVIKTGMTGLENAWKQKYQGQVQKRVNQAKKDLNRAIKNF